MNKKLIFSLAFMAVFFLLAVNVVSAYHDDYRYGYRYDDYRPNYRTESFRDSTTNTHTTYSSFRDRYNSETIRTTVTTKTDVRRSNKSPRYSYGSGYRYVSPAKFRSYDYYKPNTYTRHYRYHPTYRRSQSPSYTDYHYRPRYDNRLGHYNWRY